MRRALPNPEQTRRSVNAELEGSAPALSAHRITAEAGYPPHRDGGVLAISFGNFLSHLKG
jgi:hypothetical protein